MNARSLLITAGILGGTAVVFGAFGAHALKEALDPDSLNSFNTAVRYQMWHALALLALAASPVKIKQLKNIARLWLFGVLLFSGSIYLLSIDELMNVNLSFLGPITPLGGLALIVAWIMLIVSALKIKE
ncbi:MAG: DUF423 domain-containing protein [Bacteroidetes bacterium]|nr:DUF423 domain-containing protein [Bacteroidota bacterium]